MRAPNRRPSRTIAGLAPATCRQRNDVGNTGDPGTGDQIEGQRRALGRAGATADCADNDEQRRGATRLSEQHQLPSTPRRVRILLVLNGPSMLPRPLPIPYDSPPIAKKDIDHMNRRSFVRGSIAAAVAAAFPGSRGFAAILSPSMKVDRDFDAVTGDGRASRSRARRCRSSATACAAICCCAGHAGLRGSAPRDQRADEQAPGADRAAARRGRREARRRLRARDRTCSSPSSAAATARRASRRATTAC